MTASIVAAGAYIPTGRLDRAAAGIGKGTRSVASFDEDAVSLAVEAARRALTASNGSPPTSVLLATTSPPYQDRSNATAVHGALDLGDAVAAYDMVGAMRSTIGALRASTDAAHAGRTTLLVGSDIRCGLPGSVDERDGGDAGAAWVVGPEGPALGEVLAIGSATRELLDRWRIPGELSSRTWEDRFGIQEFTELASKALHDAVTTAGLTVKDVDAAIVTGLHRRAVATARTTLGFGPEAHVDDLTQEIGVSGAAHPLVVMSAALETASPGDLLALVTIADGADCIIVRAGSLAGTAQVSPSVASQLPGRSVAYNDILVWRGLLRREAPRRPDPDRPAAPPSSRNVSWKFGFVGSRCTQCGTRHLPPARVCLGCHSVDQMEREALAGVRGKIVTFSVDHLAFSVAPPVVAAVVDLDGGGRIQCELADVEPDAVAVDDRVELTFRRAYTTVDGVHNYVWKARPAVEES